MVQRRLCNKKMDPVRRKCLNNLEFMWSVHEAAWEEMFAMLAKFKLDMGHCNVKELHITDNGTKLGEWVCTQRRSR